MHPIRGCLLFLIAVVLLDIRLAETASVDIFFHTQAHVDQGPSRMQGPTQGIVAPNLPLQAGPSFVRPLSAGVPETLGEWFSAPEGAPVAHERVYADIGPESPSQGRLDIQRPRVSRPEGLTLAPGDNTRFWGMVTGHMHTNITLSNGCSVDIAYASSEAWVFVGGALHADLGGSQMPREALVSFEDLMLHGNEDEAYSLDVFFACRALDAPERCRLAVQTDCPSAREGLPPLPKYGIGDVIMKTSRQIAEGGSCPPPSRPAANNTCVCPPFRCGEDCALLDCGPGGVVNTDGDASSCDCLPGWAGPLCSGCEADRVCLSPQAGEPYIPLALSSANFERLQRIGAHTFLADSVGDNQIVALEAGTGAVLAKARNPSNNALLDCDCSLLEQAPPRLSWSSEPSPGPMVIEVPDAADDGGSMAWPPLALEAPGTQCSVSGRAVLAYRNVESALSKGIEKTLDEIGLRAPQRRTTLGDQMGLVVLAMAVVVTAVVVANWVREPHLRPRGLMDMHMAIIRALAPAKA